MMPGIACDCTIALLSASKVLTEASQVSSRDCLGSVQSQLEVAVAI